MSKKGMMILEWTHMELITIYENLLRIIAFLVALPRSRFIQWIVTFVYDYNNPLTPLKHQPTFFFSFFLFMFVQGWIFVFHGFWHSLFTKLLSEDLKKSTQNFHIFIYGEKYHMKQWKCVHGKSNIFPRQ